MASWRDLCNKSATALAAGKRNEARRLARQAARLAPHQEEPWLLLAALVPIDARAAYLKRALDINPRSERARKGLRWADENAKGQKTEGRGTLSRDFPGKGTSEGRHELAAPRFGNAIMMSMLMITAAFATFAILRPPEVDESLRLAGAAVAYQFDGLLASETPSPIVTASPTPTASGTPTSTPTDTPYPTETPTTGANPGDLEKYKIEPPRDLDSPDERWIDINLTDQTLSVYDGADFVDSFLVSTGTWRTPTVTGEFRIWVKVPMQDMSGPGYYIKDVPWVMYFYKSYGIHGTWWHNNFGNPMSAGCVNMAIPDAEWVYSWAQVGTVVNVHY